MVRSRKLIQVGILLAALAYTGPAFCQDGFFPQAFGCFRKLLPSNGLLPTLKFKTDSEVQRELNSRAGVKIEIGAADAPYCISCLQVDKYASQRDMFAKGLHRKLGRLPADEEVDAEIARTGMRDESVWAAAKAGVLADANYLPFADGSVTLFVSKGFPWFGPSATPDRIEPVLAEYKRALAEHGAVYLLGGPGNEPMELFAEHAAIARRLGFKVQPLWAPGNRGLILSHDRSPG